MISVGKYTESLLAPRTPFWCVGFSLGFRMRKAPLGFLFLATLTLNFGCLAEHVRSRKDGSKR